LIVSFFNRARLSLRSPPPHARRIIHDTYGFWNEDDFNVACHGFKGNTILKFPTDHIVLTEGVHAILNFSNHDFKYLAKIADALYGFDFKAAMVCAPRYIY